MLLREKLYTADEFWEYAEQPENLDRRLELAEGVIVDVSPSKPLNTVIAVKVASAFGSFVYANNLGWVTGADGGFELGPKKVRLPDTAFISFARAPKLPKRFKVAPEIAVEVVSPDEDIFKKSREYLLAGTIMVWAVYAEDQEVHVFTLDVEGAIRTKTFGLNDTLDGGSVLPGFTLPVRDIFPSTLNTTASEA